MFFKSTLSRLFKSVVWGCVLFPAVAHANVFVERGPYEVGVRMVFFHDPARAFDGWNASYGSPRYKTLLQRIHAAGERQVVVAYIWYPADAQGTSRRATFADFSKSSSPYFVGTYKNLARGHLLFFLVNQNTVTLADKARRLSEIYKKPEVSAKLYEAMEKRFVTSFLNAPVASGRFPIVIAAHGARTSVFTWFPLAEYLASHGYVVVAPNFLADGVLSQALDSPDAQFAKTVPFPYLDMVYNTMHRESKILYGAYKQIFGDSFEGFEKPIKGSVVAGGEENLNGMMREFFAELIADIRVVLEGLESLNKNKNMCLLDFAQKGQPIHGTQVCGFFGGAFDMERVGILGFSFGSVAAQLALARDDRFLAAVGYNAAIPKAWEPKENPKNVPLQKPLLQIHGSEDIVMHNLYKTLLWDTLKSRGGDPKKIFQIESERHIPTSKNPQPIARSAYARATGDKAIIQVQKTHHTSLLQDVVALSSSKNPIVVEKKVFWSDALPRPKKTLEKNALYQPLGWGRIGEKNVYLPVFIRNYYTKHWFDFYLKGEGEPLPKIPLGREILEIRSSIK